MSEPSSQYESWDKDRLISRIRQLENDLHVKAQSTSSAPEAAASASATIDAPTLDQPSKITSPALPKRRKKAPFKLDPSRYHTRFIALKLAYLGKRFGGFEHQPSATLPTIESELWAALVKTCLVFPEKGNDDGVAEVDFTPCEYSKCGRTDRGVSAFGQVIGIRVRSNQPVARPRPRPGQETNNPEPTADTGAVEGASQVEAEPQPELPAWDPINDELPYPKVLNKVLPSDIRILAWCPSPPPGFSARFSCRERQYRYFFTQPAFLPPPWALASAQPSQSQLSLPSTAEAERGQGQERPKPAPGWLDIDAMRTAARHFKGHHDFRNFCKVDGGKQVTNFWREMLDVDIVEVEDAATALPYLTQGGGSRQATFPQVYSFNVCGSAFLWHQIRHMVSVLFLVGQGFEPPSIVADLLDVERTPRKPAYVLADDVPLVLWDCIFPNLSNRPPEPEGKATVPGAVADVDSASEPPGAGCDLTWVYDTDAVSYGAGRFEDFMWRDWREKKIDEVLANRLLDVASTSVAAFSRRRQQEQQGGKQQEEEKEIAAKRPAKVSNVQKVFNGDNDGKITGGYIPLMQRQTHPTPEEINEKWAQRKGFASAEEMRAWGNWRAVIKEAKNAANASGGGGGDGRLG